MKEEKMKLPKITLDDFFTTQEERDNKNREYVKMIPVNEITNFPNHPYKVRDDDEMFSMAETVKQFGVIHPVIVRPKENGGYEMISGHRRKRACEIAGVTQIKAIVREMTDEEATIAMVNSNNQREKILPSERAFAFKMKMEAMKRQAGRPKKGENENSAPLEQNFIGKTTRELIAEETGESSSNIQRFIRLTELIPELLKLVDEEKMKLRPAVELSYLTKEEQQQVFDAIEYTDAFPSHPQAIKMKKLSENGSLTMEEIDDILEQEKPNQIPKFKIPEDKVEQYIPKEYKSMEEKEDYIVHCVKETSERERKQKQKQNEYMR